MRTGCWDCLRSRIDLFEVTMLKPMAFGAFVALFVTKGACRMVTEICLGDATRIKGLIRKARNIIREMNIKLIFKVFTI